MTTYLRPEEEAAGRAEHAAYGSEYQTPAWEALSSDERERFCQSAMLRVTAYLRAVTEDVIEEMARTAFVETQHVPWASATGAKENFRRYMRLGINELAKRAYEGVGYGA